MAPIPDLKDWFDGVVAQLGERRVRNAEVRGSIPLGSTMSRHPPPRVRFRLRRFRLSPPVLPTHISIQS